MHRPFPILAASVIGLSMLAYAAPVLIVLANAVVPLVLAVGAVILMLRLAWHFTNRY